MALAAIDVKPGAMPPDTPNLNMCVHEWHIYSFTKHIQHDSQDSFSNKWMRFKS